MQKLHGIFVLLVLLSGTFSTYLAFADSPVITILGNNPETVFVGDTYSDAGATASDTEDGDLTDSIGTDGLPIDTSSAGSFIVTYAVIDLSDNTAVQVRTVNVVTNDSPVITILGDNPVIVLSSSTYVDAGATASDTEDDDATLTITTTNNVDTTTPGSYTVDYEVTDSDGNTTMESRTVNVVTNDSPVITILGDNPVIVLSSSTYVDAGATASDTEDDDATLTITTTNNVDTTTPGSYTVDYEVTDSDGNTTMESRTVNVMLPDSKATQMSIVIDTLIGLKDTTDDKTDKKIDKVIKKINKAMNSKYWDESGTELTSKKGKKVFDETKKAVKDLLKISKKSDFGVYPEITNAVDMLVGISEQLATDAIDDAQAFAGDKKVDKEIKKSNKEMGKAQKELDKGKLDKAIDKYKKAWEHAQKALKKKK